MVAGIDKFLLRKIDESVEKRAQYWKRDFSSPEAYNKSIEPNRQRLAKMLGVVDGRVKFEAPEFISTKPSALIAAGEGFDVYAVRWPVLAHPAPQLDETVSVHGEGLLLIPTARQPVADIIALPDADQTPEQLVGLAEGVGVQSQFARRLAENGCRVIVPVLISRDYKARNGRASMTNREYIYRTSFELGRHIIGYELQKVLACVDWFEQEAQAEERGAKVGIIGYGEGGMLALHAAALDTRIDATVVSGYFGPLETSWQQPLSRNLFGLLREFGAAELAMMVAPRALSMEMSVLPERTFPSKGGAPARLDSPNQDSARREWHRLPELWGPKGFGEFTSIEGEKPEEFCGVAACRAIVSSTGVKTVMADALARPAFDVDLLPDATKRQQHQLAELDHHNQALLAESPYVRKERFWNKLDYSLVEAFEKSVAPFREEFKYEVIGHFDDKPLPFNPRTRKAYDEDKWVGYEVMLDLWPDVFCYGILCLPKDMQRDGSEQRPVVVCQHGLEGRPQDIVAGDHRAYHDFASKLCERGFITFSPQNLYIGKDKFRTLQRKANPLGKTLFSIITPQHQQIIDWLKTQPYVDGERIGFYGLSYGGKTAMRVPPLVDDYRCVIASADFNDWVGKKASTRSRYGNV